MHIYGSELIFCDRPDKVDVAHFTTDSGLHIGLMTSFDINFREPAMQLLEVGVNAIAFCTAWVDGLPFNTGNFCANKNSDNEVEQILQQHPEETTA